MRTHRRGWLLGHRGSLDGLRGVAILMVVACHVLDTWHVRFHPLGIGGVTLFFTLSGFLITSLLIEEYDARGTVRMGRFFRNRALRLFPALIVVALVATTYEICTGIGAARMLAPVALYVANWATVSGHSLGLMAHSWSLSIEEQFYLVWPLALVAVRRWRRGLLVLTVVGILVSTALRFVLWDGAAGTRVHYGSDTEAASLLVGCLLALLAHRGLPPIRAPWLAPTGVTGLALISGWRSDFATAVLVPTVVPPLAAAMIWQSCSAAGGLLGMSWLRYLGRRSYGWYLWHFPIVMTAHRLTSSLAVSALSALAALGVAELSYRYVELPFLRLKTSTAAAGSGRTAEAVPAVVGGR